MSQCLSFGVLWEKKTYLEFLILFQEYLSLYPHLRMLVFLMANYGSLQLLLHTRFLGDNFYLKNVNVYYVLYNVLSTL